MGVLNITPDSFSDGGRCLDPGAAIEAAARLESEGADILDIGGESTRPGAAPVDEEEELRRVLPVVRAVRSRSAIAISIDTMKPGVARAAFDAGADIWNDVTALRYSPDSVAVAAAIKAPVILMHMLGEPRTMQSAPHYQMPVTRAVTEFFSQRIGAAVEAGVKPANLWLDPGIGFGKTLEHNLVLMRDLADFAVFGRALVVGASRKSFIARIDHDAPPDSRLGGSLAAALWAAQAGAAVVRVHDVAATAQALAVWRAISGARDEVTGRSPPKP
jgi:dihydropteroate synthase